VALVLGMMRRLVVSVAPTAIQQVQTHKTRWSVRRYQQRFAHRDGGPGRASTRWRSPNPQLPGVYPYENMRADETALREV
jgi:hypothetical protein